MRGNFVGRQSYLNLLEKRIRDLKDGYRQNIAIIGDEAVGKTSIISRLLNKFCDNHILTLYLEVRPESLSAFVKRFIAILLYNFLINSGIPLKEDLDFLIKSADKYIPKTVEAIKSILAGLEKRRKVNIFSELLELCNSIYNETGKFCVVIFDEFTLLENTGIKDLYAEWSRLLISQKNTLYIIISSMRFKAGSVLAKNLSLLFGNFEILTVEPFDIRTAEEYLNSRLQSTGLSQGLKNFIVNFTGGYPFYLEAISAAIAQSYQNNLADLLEDLLFESSGMLNQRFFNYFKRFLDSPHSQDYGAILYQVASGQNRINDLAHILRRSKRELNLRVNQLLELDAISRSGDFLKINDRVFAFWLKFVYQNKLHSLTLDAGSQKAFFRDNIEKQIKEFMVSAEKPVIERMAELLRLFADESVQFGRKRLRLAHFREIKPLEFKTGSLQEGLIGRSNDTLWILGLKQDPLTEDDVTEFARECKKYRHKLQMKIIVSLKDIDANTRLRALEEKIWTWDINNLNHILDLFSKPRVIA